MSENPPTESNASMGAESLRLFPADENADKPLEIAHYAADGSAHQNTRPMAPRDATGVLVGDLPDLPGLVFAYLDATQAGSSSRRAYGVTVRKWRDFVAGVPADAGKPGKPRTLVEVFGASGSTAARLGDAAAAVGASKQGGRSSGLTDGAPPNRTPANSKLHGSRRPMQFGRPLIDEFLTFVHSAAIATGGGNPGRTANKARAHLSAVFNWAVDEFDPPLCEPPSKMPRKFDQRTVAGHTFLTDAEVSALYWATYDLTSPRGWREHATLGAFWRAALLVFYTYGFDTQTVFPFEPDAAPLRWRDVFDGVEDSPIRHITDVSAFGWLLHVRKKSSKRFCRPMSREVALHLAEIRPPDFGPDEPVFGTSGGCRPNARFQELCKLAGIGPKLDPETFEPSPRVLKDLRKTCATVHQANIPGASIAVLGHSAQQVTLKHYASDEPLAFRAILSLPLPACFRSVWNSTIQRPAAGARFLFKDM